jgi:hypothetical protein
VGVVPVREQSVQLVAHGGIKGWIGGTSDPHECPQPLVGGEPALGDLEVEITADVDGEQEAGDTDGGGDEDRRPIAGGRNDHTYLPLMPPTNRTLHGFGGPPTRLNQGGLRQSRSAPHRRRSQ